MFLKGREITRVEYGMRIFKRLVIDLEVYGNVEKGAEQEGNIISLMFVPKSGKNTALKGRKEEHGQEIKTENQQGSQKAL
jgi:hypothetical protein